MSVYMNMLSCFLQYYHIWRIIVSINIWCLKFFQQILQIYSFFILGCKYIICNLFIIFIAFICLYAYVIMYFAILPCLMNNLNHNFLFLTFFPHILKINFFFILGCKYIILNYFIIFKAFILSYHGDKW